MDKNKVTYDKEEIERLCQLYLEGELTLKEEQDLAVVLSYVGNSDSEVVAEVLFLMGISRTAAKVSDKSGSVSDSTEPLRKRPYGRWLKICSAAAVVAVSIIIGWHFHRDESSSENEICEVYAFGKKITDKEKSQEMALESYNRSMEFLARMQRLEEEKMAVVENMQQSLKSNVNQSSAIN